MSLVALTDGNSIFFGGGISQCLHWRHSSESFSWKTRKTNLICAKSSIIPYLASVPAMLHEKKSDGKFVLEPNSGQSFPPPSEREKGKSLPCNVCNYVRHIPVFPRSIFDFSGQKKKKEQCPQFTLKNEKKIQTRRRNGLATIWQEAVHPLLHRWSNDR